MIEGEEDRSKIEYSMRINRYLLGDLNELTRRAANHLRTQVQGTGVESREGGYATPANRRGSIAWLQGRNTGKTCHSVTKYIDITLNADDLDASRAPSRMRKALSHAQSLGKWRTQRGGLQARRSRDGLLALRPPSH